MDAPVKSPVIGLPLDLEFRTKGQLGIDTFAAAYADGISFDFAYGDEACRSCTCGEEDRVLAAKGRTATWQQLSERSACHSRN